MGRFCLCAYTGLTDRFRRPRGFLYNLASLLKLIRSEKKQCVTFGKIFVWWRTKAILQTKMWELLLTNEWKSKEKSKNSASRRRWWSVEGLNRTSFQACGSICNKSKVGWVTEFFYFFIAIFRHINQPCPNWAIFLRKSGTQGKLAQNGQMLHDNCWAIRLITALLLTFMSHIQSHRHREDLVG